MKTVIYTGSADRIRFGDIVLAHGVPCELANDKAAKVLKHPAVIEEIDPAPDHGGTDGGADSPDEENDR